MTDLLAPSINSQKSLACTQFTKYATLSDTGSNVPKKNSPRVTFARLRQWTPPSFEYPMSPAIFPSSHRAQIVVTDVAEIPQPATLGRFGTERTLNVRPLLVDVANGVKYGFDCSCVVT